MDTRTVTIITHREAGLYITGLRHCPLPVQLEAISSYYNKNRERLDPKASSDLEEDMAAIRSIIGRT